MKSILLAGGALAALCMSAEAATLSYSAFDGSGSFSAPSTTLETSFTAGATTSDGTMTSPFGATSTEPYDVVHGGGSATFEGATTGSGSFGTGSGTFNLLWGSPDNYNTLTFLLDGTPLSGLTFSGSQVAGGSQSGSYLVSITGLPTYNGIEFTSTSDAFEFAAVSAVPLPTSLPMFGGAVLLLGALGVMTRRTKAVA